MYDWVDIGNVRGIQGEKGEKGERGRTPSYDDIRYKKKNDQFITIVTDSQISQTDYYIDADGNLCDSEGHLYDEEGNLTNEIGRPFDIDKYGYLYERLYIDEQGRYTNVKGEILDENYQVQYVPSEFISDIANFIYSDEEGYNQLVTDIYPYILLTLTSPENFDKYKDFFDEIEGDIKYYICVDNPELKIVSENDEINNTCRFRDENGNIALDENNSPKFVPLEKNALYLYDRNGGVDGSVMHYDIYLCTKANTVPIKLISSSDFTVSYNIIDNLGITTTDNNHDDENEVWLNMTTRGSGQVYTTDEIDTLFNNNVISKLGANNGIAQLNNSGKVPSNQLPAYIDDVVEGTMNSDETTFTPSNNDYIDSVRQTGKIYVDTSTRKTYRWSGSSYIFISNPIVVDDGSTEAYASASGQALEDIVGDSTLTTTANDVTSAINELESDKEEVSNKVSSWSNTTTDNHYPSEKLVKDSVDLKINKSDIATNLTTDSDSKVLSAKQGKTLNDNKQDKTDNSLNTTSKTIVGAINELKSNKSESNHNHGIIQNNGSISSNSNETDTSNVSKIVVIDNNNTIKTINTLPLGKVTHQDISGKINTTAIKDNLTDGGSNNVLSAEQGKVLNNNKQDKTDNSLNTTSKQVVGAINELDSKIENISISEELFDELVDELSKQNVVLYSDKDIIQSGDSVKLSARMFGYPSINGNVQFYDGNTLLDTVAPVGGIASYDYVGTGAGLKEFNVKYGNSVSETYEVYDCVFKDIGNTDNHSNWNLSSVTYTQTDDYVTLDNTASSSKWVYPQVNGSNDILDSNTDYCWEVDIKNVDATALRLGLCSVQIDNVQSYLSTSDFTTVKLYTAKSENKVYYIINGTTRSVTASSSFSQSMYFRLLSGETIQFKNMKVYPI